MSARYFQSYRTAWVVILWREVWDWHCEELKWHCEDLKWHRLEKGTALRRIETGILKNGNGFVGDWGWNCYEYGIRLAGG